VPRLVIDLRDARSAWTAPDWAIAEISRAVPARLEVLALATLADGRGDGGPASSEAIEAISDAEIYVGFGFPRSLFEVARRAGTLRWIHSGAAGVGGALHPEMLDSPLLLTNSAGIHAEPIADTVLAMIHYFARGLDFAVAAQRERSWGRVPFDSRETPVRELAGRTVGVVGFGGIGRAVSARARSLGMSVLAFRRRDQPGPPDVQVLRGAEGLRHLLRNSHYVVLSLPRTPETEYLLHREHLSLLRPDAVLVNVGRGELIDEPALIESLADGRIRGAGLDVFVQEPLGPDSPFWTLPNVLITPHVSATTDRYWRREVDLIVENLGRYERGESLVNLVDKRAGY
jgi:phosphoglycerate dehydrogenase-like enzyme